MVGDDDVARTTVQGYQHGGGRLLRGQDVGVLDLRQAGIIPDGALLGSTGCTSQVSYALSVSVLTAVLNQGNDGCIVIWLSKSTA